MRFTLSGVEYELFGSLLKAGSYKNKEGYELSGNPKRWRKTDDGASTKKKSNRTAAPAKTKLKPKLAPQQAPSSSASAGAIGTKNETGQFTLSATRGMGGKEPNLTNLVDAESVANSASTNPDRVAALKQNIAKHGQARPIIVLPTGEMGEYSCFDGADHLEAIKQLETEGNYSYGAQALVFIAKDEAHAHAMKEQFGC
jgi:ParB-like nuclease domain